MNEVTKRIAIFLLICIPIRLTIDYYVIKFNYPLISLFIAAAFLYKAIMSPGDKVGYFGGKMTWSRYVMVFYYSVFAYLVFYGRNKEAMTVSRVFTAIAVVRYLEQRL